MREIRRLTVFEGVYRAPWKFGPLEPNFHKLGVWSETNLKFGPIIIIFSNTFFYFVKLVSFRKIVGQIQCLFSFGSHEMPGPPTSEVISPALVFDPRLTRLLGHVARSEKNVRKLVRN